MSCTLDLDRGPSLDELLWGCIEAFDAQGKVRDPHLVRLFLTMQPWYQPPTQLAETLLHIIADTGGSPEGPNLRLKIGYLVRYWVRAFPGELRGDPELRGLIQALREALGEGDPGGDPEIGDPDSDPGSDPETPGDLDGGGALGEGAGQGEPPRTPPRRKRSLLLEHLGPAELAATLTHMEHRVITRVTARDVRSFARCGGPSRSPSLRRLVARSNAVSRWAQLLVLAPLGPPQRARALERLLRLAEKLLELRNFQTLLAVVGGLGHGSITRLRRTLALLPPDITQLWSRLSEVVGSGGNYRRYRALLGGCGGAGGFRLPAMGVHLRDLVSLEEALPDWGGPSRPHPDKLQRRFAILGTLLGSCGTPPVPAHPDLLHLLTVSLDLGPTEEQLYQLSLQREPRARGATPPPLELPPPSSPLDEWVLPEPPRPDPQLLRGHLERLVESIFCHFDVDGDGRISLEEFGTLRENFPQLGGFGELDTDRDGSLSRGEVLAHFLRCSELGGVPETPPPGTPPPGPPHSFEWSRSLLRPSACAQCGGTILGLHKLGLKCRTCGLRCHSHCRDRLRVECRRRAQSVAADPPPGSPPAQSPSRSFSFSLPRPRRSSLPPREPPRELQELEDGVFDTHL